jgi:hypothetical protein
VTPKPWSHSALEAFKNCPRSFHEATIWGEVLHKHFEDRLTDGVVLPPEVAMHEPFLGRLEAMPGVMSVEQRIALDRTAKPCEFFADDVWFRGVIDVKIVDGAHALLVDHKSGKHHSKFGQLRLFALHTFAAHPEVETVRAEYYWTQTMTKNGEGYARADVPQLWAGFIPDLKQYAQAFRTDTWQPRQSGLCRGWCPVTSCEFWSPKRKRG